MRIFIYISIHQVDITHINGCRIYLDIMKGEKLSSIKVAKMDIVIGQLVHRVGEEGVRDFSENNFYFIRLHYNLV